MPRARHHLMYLTSLWRYKKAKCEVLQALLGATHCFHMLHYPSSVLWAVPRVILAVPVLRWGPGISRQWLWLCVCPWSCLHRTFPCSALSAVAPLLLIHVHIGFASHVQQNTFYWCLALSRTVTNIVCITCVQNSFTNLVSVGSVFLCRRRMQAASCPAAHRATRPLL